MGALYRLDFPNGKSYVGITTKTTERRFRTHAQMAEEGHASALARAIRKYGAQAVRLSTLAELDDWEALCLAEQLAIEKFRTHTPTGYNMTAGGDGVVDPDEEVRQKMSAASKRTWSSEELRQWRSATSKAQWADPISRAANGALTKARCKDPAYLAQMSTVAKASWADPKSRANQLAGRAMRSMLHYAGVQVRLAYGECLKEGRPCSRIE